MTRSVNVNDALYEALIGGADSWAVYRRTIPSGHRYDLTNADLKGLNLIFADLSYADLSHADLTGVILTGANLSHADLSHADLTRAILTDANLTRANLSHADLTRVRISAGKLSHTNVVGANFSHAFLVGANFNGARLMGANCSSTRLMGANFIEATLEGTNLTDAILVGANLNRASLIEANLTRANLRRANLTGANLIRAELVDADLSNVRLNEETVDPTGRSFSFLLNSTIGNEPLEAGITRLKVNLPRDVDPEILAGCAVASAAISRLASLVGAQLQQDLFGSHSPESSGNLLLATADDSSVIRVRRTHYGSPWIIDLIEVWNSMGPGLGTAAFSSAIGVGAGGVWFVQKNSLKILATLLPLARKTTRNLWWQGIEEDLREKLEAKRASTSHHKKQRLENETAIAKLEIAAGTQIPKLEIEAGTQDDYERRLKEFFPDDPQKLDQYMDALQELKSILDNGATVTTAVEDEPEKTEGDPS